MKAERPTSLEPYDVRLLPEEGADLDQALSPEWIAEALNAEGGAPPELTLAARGPGRAELHLEPIGQTGATPTEVAVRVRGRAHVALATECVRCLADLELSIDSPIDLTLFPETTGAAPGDEATAPAPAGGGRAKKKKTPKVELKREALDEGLYFGHLIDLPAIVREALLLGLDMNPCCADVEACSRRTEALVSAANETASSEAPEPEERPIDPRWAKLIKLRSNSS
jgi:uncharacterized metal-binding protein YceD (DUF177 family)